MVELRHAAVTVDHGFEHAVDGRWTETVPLGQIVNRLLAGGERGRMRMDARQEEVVGCCPKRVAQVKSSHVDSTDSVRRTTRSTRVRQFSSSGRCATLTQR